MATPDHWHTPGAILAADAGKHVYVEKPCSHNVREGRLLIDAAKRNKVVIQVGTQSRSTPTCAEAMKRVHDGAIGEVLVAKAWNSQLRRNLGQGEGERAAEAHRLRPVAGAGAGGPVLRQPRPRLVAVLPRLRGRRHGQRRRPRRRRRRVGDEPRPRSPTASPSLAGKYFFDDDQEWPDTQYVVCEYDAGNGGPKPRQFIYEQRIWSPYVQEDYENGCAFYGTKGMLIVGHSERVEAVRREEQADRADERQGRSAGAPPELHRRVPEGRQAGGPGGDRARLGEPLPPGEHQRPAAEDDRTRPGEGGDHQQPGRERAAPPRSTAPTTGPSRRACERGRRTVFHWASGVAGRGRSSDERMPTQ